MIAAGWWVSSLSQQKAYDAFFENKEILVKTIASSIDGDTLKDIDLGDGFSHPHYRDYQQMLAAVYEQDKSINNIYAISYYPSYNLFNYTIDGEIVQYDTIWIESKEIAFEATNANGLLEVWHNDKKIWRRYTHTDKIGRLVAEVKDNQFYIDGSLVLTLEWKSFETSLGTMNRQQTFFDLPYVLEDRTFYFSFSPAGMPATEPGSEFLAKLNVLANMRKVIQTNQWFTDKDMKDSAYGNVVSTYAPIQNAKGEAVWLVVIDARYDQLKVMLVSLILRIIWLFIVVVIVVTLLIIAGSTYMTKPFKTMFTMMSLIGKGKFDDVPETSRQDEIGELMQWVYDLGKTVQKNQQKIKDLANAYKHFVPEDTIKQLEKDHITNVAVNDHVQKFMTILFIDIRNFTTFSEAVGPSKTFHIVNQLWADLVPVVLKYHGFIDKYIGDAMMALFPTNPQDAVTAAVELKEAAEKFNEKIDYEGRIDIGVGVHCGVVILGVVWDENHMAVTVMWDAVNTASRLESQSKNYDNGIIVSQAIIDNIDTHSFDTTELGVVRVKGKTKDLSIHKVNWKKR